MRPCVYISGPITKGDRNLNVCTGYCWQQWFMRNGFAPLNPIATCVAPFAWEPWATHDLWIDCDLPWIAKADLVFRIMGESEGADREVEFAKANGIIVVEEKCEKETEKQLKRFLEIWKQSSTNAAASNPASTPDSLASLLMRLFSWRSASGLEPASTGTPTGTK
jgi:hypothetical protein